MPAVSPYFRHKIGRPKYPGLWRGCIGAYCPSVFGPSGLTCYDFSGNSRHAAVTGATALEMWTTNQGQYAATFGAGDYLDCGRHAELESATRFTISFWFRRAAPNTMGAFIGRASSSANLHACRIYDDTQVYCWPGSQSANRGQFTSNDTLWHHACWVYNGTLSAASRLVGYLDGRAASVISGTIPTTTASNTEHLVIGRAVFAGSDGSGWIDDVRIYDVDLTPQEARLLSLRRGIAYEVRPPVIAHDQKSVLLDARRRAVVC